MTDDAYTKLTPTQRAVRAAFVRDLRSKRPGCCRATVPRLAAATGLPEAVVRRTLAELGDMATRYWLGKGAAA